MNVASTEDPGRLADTIVAHLNLKLQDKQMLLEIADPGETLRADAIRNRDSLGGEKDSGSREKANGEVSERVLPQ